MTIRWVEKGADSAWEVWVGGSRRRLFVARKLGGRDEAYEAAADEERRMRAAQPPLAARVAERVRALGRWFAR